MNVFNIARSFEMKAKQGWPKLYWAIDLHDVLIIGRHNKFNEGRELCPSALEVMRWIKKRPDMAWILYSCSHKEPTDDMVKWLDSFGIAPDYINENPECRNGHLCDFSKKFYFDILLEDKAGFDAMHDWHLIKSELLKIGEWEGKLLPRQEEVDSSILRQNEPLLGSPVPSMIASGAEWTAIAEEAERKIEATVRNAAASQEIASLSGQVQDIIRDAINRAIAEKDVEIASANQRAALWIDGNQHH